jgi:WD40 repeat protein
MFNLPYAFIHANKYLALRNPTPPGPPALWMDYFGFSVSMSSSSSNKCLVGGHGDKVSGMDYGSAYIFNATTGALLLTLSNPEPATGDLFGYSVAISADGTKCIVSAPYDDFGSSNSGSVYIFNVATGALLRTIRNPIVESGDAFGFSVSISDDGSRCIVGAPYDNYASADDGSAYVFDTTTGALLATLHRTGTAYFGDAFGFSVAISGNGSKCVVGAPRVGDPKDTGAVYVFNAATGAIIASIVHPYPTTGGLFGGSVGMCTDGSKCVAGASSDDHNGIYHSGAAYVLNATTGAVITKLTKPGAEANDSFGNAVAMSGDGTKCIVGTQFDDLGNLYAGAAHVFNSTTGAVIAAITNPEPGWGEVFGCSVTISSDGNKYAVGAYQDAASGNAVAGRAYIF